MADAQPTLAQHIASFVATKQFSDMPDDVIAVAKRCVVDSTAVMLAGSREECASILRDYAKAINGAKEASIIGVDSIKAPLATAALVNGTAGHALDWDDTALSLESDRSVLLHPSMQPLVACYGLGEVSEALGTDFLTGFVLGVEVGVKIAEAIAPTHFTGGRGFHSTGTIGVFGSCVAACKLLKLGEGEITNAIAIAATEACGIGANHGTMAKPLNMGLAAENGIQAAKLASLGFDGPKHALEGGRGFFEAFGGGYDETKIIGRLGSPFALLEPGVSIKPYPSGVVGHPGMDAMREIITKHDIAPDTIASIHIKTGENVLAPGPLRISHATTALEGKFCVPFQMAAIALRRKAGLAEFNDAFVQSAACQALQKKVTAVLDPSIIAMGKDKVVFDISVETLDGQRYRGRSPEFYRGGPKNPLTWDEVAEKFTDCAEGVLASKQQAAFLSAIENLAEVDNVAAVVGLIRG